MAEAIPEADAHEQQRPVDSKLGEDDGRLQELERERQRRPHDAGEAAEADLLEQAETVGFDEEEAREGRTPRG